MKTCNECGVSKPLNQFYKNRGKRYKDGHFNKCKDCDNARQKKRRQAKRKTDRSEYYARFRKYR